MSELDIKERPGLRLGEKPGQTSPHSEMSNQKIQSFQALKLLENPDITRYFSQAYPSLKVSLGLSSLQTERRHDLKTLKDSVE